jgi:hypothetical protein
MKIKDLGSLIVETKLLYSASLRRYVTVDFYLPKNIANPSQLSLLLINDGQDLHHMNFNVMLNDCLKQTRYSPFYVQAFMQTEIEKKNMEQRTQLIMQTGAPGQGLIKNLF